MDEFIQSHFERGYAYKEILVLLKSDMGIDISYRQLKRHLRRLHLRRRGVWDVDQIQNALQSELCGSGRNLGCRSMTQRLRSRHGMSVGRNVVLHQLKLLDPEGVEARRSHRLVRRVYRNKGPNFLVHVDGYDKIKRYGFAIHGAIDGSPYDCAINQFIVRTKVLLYEWLSACGGRVYLYSRRVLWLKVNRTNNDPKVVASYFLDFVKEVKGVPRCIRMDAGTENVDIANMQKSFRWFHRDAMSGEKSILIGSSPSNQRIECWWRRLHEMCIAAWQEVLGDLESRGIFSTANFLHIEFVRFCFTQIIQRELDLVRQEWNDHQIRRQNRDEVHGKPEILYQHPELYGTRDYAFPVDMEDVATLRSFCKTTLPSGCDEPLQTILFGMLESIARPPPETLDDAKDLLQWLTHYFQ